MFSNKRLKTIYLSVLLLVTIGIGFAIVYANYFQTKELPLTRVQIQAPRTGNSPSAALPPTVRPRGDRRQLEPVPVGPLPVEDMTQRMIDWADQHEQTVLYNDAFVAGIGFYARSSFLEDTITITASPRGVSDGVFIENDPLLIEANVSDSVFLPRSNALKVAGFYEPSERISFLSYRDFLYPLKMASSCDGTFFIEPREVDSFVALFDNSGYDVLSVIDPEPMKNFSWRQLFTETSLVLRSILVAIFGLLLCLVYLTLISFQDLYHVFHVHRRVGLSRRRFATHILMQTIVMLIATVALLIPILKGTFKSLYAADRLSVIGITALISLPVILVANTVGVLLAFKRTKELVN